MGTTVTILILLLYVLLLGWGIYFKSYLTKKADNLATKEDFKDLKQQTSELRQATKEIEAKIDDQMWNRQRQWELKRDILVDVIKAMGEARNAQYGVIAAWTGAKSDSTEAAQNQWRIKKSETSELWRQAAGRLEGCRIMAAILGDPNINDTLRGYGNALRYAYKAITNNEPEEHFTQLMETLNQYDRETLAAARTALGIIGTATSQSNESSGAPIPDPSTPAAK
jgi:hypothetical protein